MQLYGRQWYLYFLQIVKNSTNFLQLSAIPEMLSITIRRSIETLSPKPELFSLFVMSLVLSLNFSIHDTISSDSVAR